MTEKPNAVMNFVGKTLNWAITGVNYAGKGLWYAATIAVVLVIPLQIAMEADSSSESTDGAGAAITGIIPEAK
eukprot:TRINITY_DN1896_c0_g1_i1.p1 TRINITY_DN1896_c0_g1~~TRINITY_DN1896_c0_g1_i1.p1  ORF type:complete len:73 (+),score=16.62 TRINITY_DN1896_c0_g1_i1:82-300(+)